MDLTKQLDSSEWYKIIQHDYKEMYLEVESKILKGNERKHANKFLIYS